MAAYTPVTWVNGSVGGTPMSAANLNKMEDRIEAVDLLFQGVGGTGATYPGAIGLLGTYLKSNGTSPSWAAAATVRSDISAAASTLTLTAGSGLTGGGDLSTNRSFALNISGLTADAAPDSAADYVATYDASALTHKKVLLSNLGSQNIYQSITDGGTTASAGSTADTVKFRAGAGLTVAVGSNDATHGDNVLFGLNDLLVDFAGLTQATDKLPYCSSATAMATTSLTSFMRTVLDDTTAGAARTTLGAYGAADAASLASVVTTGNVQVGGQGWSDTATLTDGTSIAVDCNSANSFVVTLAGNRTLASPSNMKNGATYSFKIKQDATGSRTLAYAAAYKFPGGIDPTLSTGASDTDIMTCLSDGVSMFCTMSKDFG